MFLSTSSLISVTFFGSLSILFLWLYLRDVHKISQIGTTTILIFVGIISLRLLLPFELHIAKTIGSEHVMTAIYSILRFELFHIYDKTYTISQLLFCIWILGSAVYAILTLKTHLQFKRFVALLPILSEPKVNRLLLSITKDFKKPISFQILYSSAITTPMLYDFRHPKIIVPTTALSDDEWYFVLKHEITHYYNHDLQIKLLGQIINILYWWNPIIHLLNKELDKILEIRVDSAVAKNLTEYQKTEYLGCLLRIIKGSPIAKQPFYASAFENGERTVLCQRFHLLLNYPPQTRKKRDGIFKSIPLLLAIFLSFGMVFEPYAMLPEHAEGVYSMTTKNSYLVLNPSGGYDVYIENEYSYCSRNSRIIF